MCPKLGRIISATNLIIKLLMHFSEIVIYVEFVTTYFFVFLGQTLPFRGEM